MLENATVMYSKDYNLKRSKKHQVLKVCELHRSVPIKSVTCDSRMSNLLTTTLVAVNVLMILKKIQFNCFLWNVAILTLSDPGGGEECSCCFQPSRTSSLFK